MHWKSIVHWKRHVHLLVAVILQVYLGIKHDLQDRKH